MNYITEINAFEQWLETHYLSISAQLLWYKLMAIFNRTGWNEWVTVDNLRLMAAMQMGREATLIKVRDELIKAGLVEYQKGKKGSPNKYRLVNCTCKRVVQSVVETVAETVAETVVEAVAETVDIYKQNKTKQIKKNINKKENVKHKRGEYGHVTLSDIEIEKLRKDYGADIADTAITFLDEYVEMKGYKHKNSNLAIRKWVVGAVKEKGIINGTTRSTTGDTIPAGNIQTGNEIVRKLMADRGKEGASCPGTVDGPFL